MVLVSIAAAFLAAASAASVSGAERGCEPRPVPLCDQAKVTSLETDEWTIEPRHEIPGARRALAVWHPSAERQELVVTERQPDGWRVARLCDPFLGGQGWQSISASNQSGHLFATTQNEVEGQGGDVFFLASLDNGRTWHIRGCIIAPHWTTLAKGLRALSELEAQVTLQQPWLGEDPSHSDPLPGLYTSTTGDGGLTWSVPKLTRRCRKCDA